MEFLHFIFVDCIFVGLGILCIKMKTLLSEGSLLRHNKRNRFPSHHDHYLN